MFLIYIFIWQKGVAPGYPLSRLPRLYAKPATTSAAPKLLATTNCPPCH